MKITKHINPLTEKESYQILIKDNENLIGEEIVKCFQKQYPNTLSVVAYAKEINGSKYNIGIAIVGLKLLRR